MVFVYLYNHMLILNIENLIFKFINE